MVEAKTIDNLGPEAHNKYMQATKLLSEEEVQKFFKTSNIAKRTEILKTDVSYPELDKLWGVKESPASPFVPPHNFFISSSDMFTYQLVPSLGTDQELEEKLTSLKKKSKAEDSEKKQLMKFVKLLKVLDKILDEIKRRKEEYHKG